jgi:hypothetical protein
MKGGGGDKAGRGGRLLPQQQPLRLESQRFRLLSLVGGCFVFCLVFLLSSRPDATAFGTGQCFISLRPRTSPSPGSRRAVRARSVVDGVQSADTFALVACSEPQGGAGRRAPAGRRQDAANLLLRLR